MPRQQKKQNKITFFPRRPHTSGKASRPKGGGNSMSPHVCLHKYSAHWSNFAARSRMYTLPPLTTGNRIATVENTEIILNLSPTILYFLTSGNSYQVDLSPSR